MRINVGFELIYDFPKPTPVITVLGIHFTRASDIEKPDHLTVSPSIQSIRTGILSAIGAVDWSLRPAGSASSVMV